MNEEPFCHGVATLFTRTRQAQSTPGDRRPLASARCRRRQTWLARALCFLHQTNHLSASLATEPASKLPGSCPVAHPSQPTNNLPPSFQHGACRNLEFAKTPAISAKNGCGPRQRWRFFFNQQKSRHMDSLPHSSNSKIPRSIDIRLARE